MQLGYYPPSPRFKICRFADGENIMSGAIAYVGIYGAALALAFGLYLTLRAAKLI
jgi:hypothetical protein